MNFFKQAKNVLILAIIFFSLGAIIFFVNFFIFQTDILGVRAEESQNVRGWLWSQNIGWISTNCYNDYNNDGVFDNCCPGGDSDFCSAYGGLSGTDFGLTYNKDTDHFLNGWAWSDRAGWICFGSTCNGVGLGGYTPPFGRPNSWACVGTPSWNCVGGSKDGLICGNNSDCPDGTCELNCSGDYGEDFRSETDLLMHLKLNELVNDGTGGCSNEDENCLPDLAQSQAIDNPGFLMPNYPDNSPVFTMGRWNNGLELDGIDDYILVENKDNLNFIDSFTIEAWIKRNTLDSEQTILGKWSEADGKSYRLWIGNDNRLRFSVFNSFSGQAATIVQKSICVSADKKYPNVVECSSDLDCGTNSTCKYPLLSDTSKWHHVAARYYTDDQNGALSLFLNGEKICTSDNCLTADSALVPDSIATTDSNLFIGSKEGASGTFETHFAGSIDNISLWNSFVLEKRIWNHANLEIDGWARVIDLENEGWFKLRGITKDHKVWGLRLSDYNNFYTIGGYMTERHSNEDADENSLISHWKLNRPLWETNVSGSVIDSYNGNSGTAYGNTSSTEKGMFNRAAKFDGINSYIDFGTEALSGPISIRAWVRPEDTAKSGAGFLSKNNNINDQSFWLGQGQDQGSIEFVVYDDLGESHSIQTVSSWTCRKYDNTSQTICTDHKNIQGNNCYWQADYQKCLGNLILGVESAGYDTDHPACNNWCLSKGLKDCYQGGKCSPNGLLEKYSGLQENAWHHIVATYNGNTQTIYRDGEKLVESSDLSFDLPLSTSNYYLGRSGPGDYFKGYIDNVAIWNKSLTHPEVIEDYKKRIPHSPGWAEGDHEYGGGSIPGSFNSFTLGNSSSCEAIELNWDLSTWATDYTYFREDNVTEDACIDRAPGTEYNVLSDECGGSECSVFDSGLDPNTGYCYDVEAHNSNGDTPITSNDPDFPAPQWISTTLCAPDNPSLEIDNSVCGELTVTWNYDSDADGYNIYRGFEADSCSSVNLEGCEPAGHLAEGLDYDSDNATGNDLIGHWKMNEVNWSGAENEVVDSSGQANHGLADCIGTCSMPDPTATNALFEKSGQFDGADDYLKFANIINPSETDFTLGAWVNPDSIGSEQTIVSQLGGMEGTGTPRSLLAINSSGEIYSDLGGLATSSSTTVSVDNWYHVVLTNSGSSVKLFINGQEENTNTISLGESDGEMRIGVDYDNTDFFNGLIDNVYLYNVAKDPEKIRLDFEAGECGGNSCGLDSGHVCHIQGNDDGNCGKEASDVSSCCFTDKRIVPFIDYYYRITTISEAGESPPSDSISSQTICYPPSEEEEQ